MNTSDNKQAEGEQDKPGNKPAHNDRTPGQGNSHDGLTRRLGADIENRGLKEKEKLKQGEGNGETERLREGSQGGSKGQPGNPAE